MLIFRWNGSRAYRVSLHRVARWPGERYLPAANPTDPQWSPSALLGSTILQIWQHLYGDAGAGKRARRGAVLIPANPEDDSALPHP
jgi:hypothetical protein